MNKSTKFVHAIASNSLIVSICNIITFVSFLWLVYDKINKNPSYTSFIVFFVALVVFVGFNFYSFRIRQENVALKSSTKHIHRINHDYRDVLYKLFSNNSAEKTKEQIAQIEAQTIQSVCQRIERIYSRLIGKDCVVSVKLITKGTNGLKYCSTYTRSEMNCERDDKQQPLQFEIGTQKNTALDKALTINPTGISHFYSANLIKDRNDNVYTNERPHFDKFYRSAIVVPIRCLDPQKIGMNEGGDDIGFLTVDTLSKNRLNGGCHVELLAAFADQMYNFFGLMRGNYKIQPNNQEVSS